MSSSSTLSRDPTQAARLTFLWGFPARLLGGAFITGLLMSIFRVNIGAVGQGLALALVGVGVFISFRVLNFPDLSVESEDLLARAGLVSEGGESQAVGATEITNEEKAEADATFIKWVTMYA